MDLYWSDIKEIILLWTEVLDGSPRVKGREVDQEEDGEVLRIYEKQQFTSAIDDVTKYILTETL